MARPPLGFAAVFRTRGPLAAVAMLVVLTACGDSLPSRPDANRRPPKTTTTTSTTTTSTTTTTTTTTTTLPPVVVPGPVKLGAVCVVPGGVSLVGDGSPVRCVDRKSPTGKPYSGAKLRWTP